MVTAKSATEMGTSMSKLYLASHGQHSCYSVKGIFDTKEAAEAFTLYHGLNNDVEEFELNPPVPQIQDGLLAWYVYGGMKETRAYRISNDDDRIDDILYFSLWSYYDYEFRGIFAENALHACKIFTEKVRAFETGNTFARRRQGMRPYHWVDVMCIEGKIVEVSERVEDEKEDSQKDR